MSTFLDVVELLISNDEAKASYADNPSAFLQGHGLDALDPNDVADAMQHAGDALPLPVAVLIDPEAGLDSAAAIDLDAQGLSLDREPFAEDTTVALDEDVPFDYADNDAPVEDVVDLLDASDTPLIGADPTALDDAPASALDTAAPLDTYSDTDTDTDTGPVDGAAAAETTIDDTGDYLTDTTELDASIDASGYETPETPLDDYQTDTALDDLDADDDLPDNFDLLD